MHSDEIIRGLETTATEKTKAYNAFENKYSNLVRELEQKQRAELFAFHKSIREQDKTEWELAKKEMDEAQANFRKANDENYTEKSRANMKFPEGSIVVTWENPRWSYDNNSIKRGERAIVQLFKDGDEVPDNKRYGRPWVGQVIYRYLKKDGTTGKKYETTDYRFHLESELLPSEKAALDKKDSFIADGV